MKTLAELIEQHGVRVRRATAMQLLGVPSLDVFKKVVDANPQLRHRLPGEGQDKYLIAEIHKLLCPAARCATRGEEPKP